MHCMQHIHIHQIYINQATTAACWENFIYSDLWVSIWCSPIFLQYLSWLFHGFHFGWMLTQLPEERHWVLRHCLQSPVNHLVRYAIFLNVSHMRRKQYTLYQLYLFDKCHYQLGIVSF